MLVQDNLAIFFPRLDLYWKYLATNLKANTDMYKLTWNQTSLKTQRYPKKLRKDCFSKAKTGRRKIEKDKHANKQGHTDKYLITPLKIFGIWDRVIEIRSQKVGFHPLWWFICHLYTCNGNINLFVNFFRYIVWKQIFLPIFTVFFFIFFFLF